MKRKEGQPKQCCETGAGTETAGTATFCLRVTGTVMHSVYGTGFEPGSNIKCNTKVKNLKLEANSLDNNDASNTEKARFCTNFLLLKNCAKGTWQRGGFSGVFAVIGSAWVPYTTFRAVPI
jgi:hypothetical protein